MTSHAPARRERRPWRPNEIAALAGEYARFGGPILAEALGRPLNSIYQKVHALGLQHQQRTDTADPAFAARLRDLHAAGLSDAQVADDLGCERHVVGKRRRAMGLPNNRLHPAQRRRVAEATAAQCRAAGVRSLAGVRALAFRDYAARSGWPADLAPREVHILAALAARGPMTRPEIAEAIGLPWIGSRLSLKSRTEGGSYLASLMRKGLVVSLGRVVRNGGKGRNLNLYAPAIGATKGAEIG